MGAAKVRKKNGTYPTAEQITAMEESRRRRDTKVWYPTAADLPLTHVPEEARPQLRKRLDPWLRNLIHIGFGERIGIKGGDCWQVAQALLMATMGDPGVVLVEGVWNRPWQIEEGDQPAPHTWCMVDGYRVDLIAEFYSWRSDDSEWVYEPLVEYTFAQVHRMFIDEDGDTYFAESFDISSLVAWKNGTLTEEMFPEHLTSDKAPNPEDYGHPGNYPSPEWERWRVSEDHQRWSDAFHKFLTGRGEHENTIVFKPAADRLIKKFKNVAVAA